MTDISEGTLVSTRIRLARNLEGYPFPSHLKGEKQAKEIIRLVSSGLNRLADFKLYYMDARDDWEANSLVENHLISRDLVARKRLGAALINDDKSISMMINEEDHLREQCIIKGLQLRRAYDRLSEIDSKIGRSIKFAYDERLGYLTACPTNLGTGLRASVMLFLPAITINDSLREVVKYISRLGLTVRGMYGEGSDAEGYMYQVSNEITLGETEDKILSLVESVARNIFEQEKAEREMLKSGERRLEVKDKCLRAYGIATNCAVLSSLELVRLAADIKLGICLGYIPIGSVAVIDDLVTRMQPCNMNRSAGRALSPDERDAYRAEYISTHLKRLASVK